MPASTSLGTGASASSSVRPELVEELLASSEVKDRASTGSARTVEGFNLANSLTSCVIFIEQNLGPHMLQKWAVLAPSAGRVWSWYCSAVSGSSDRLNWSRQRNSNRARLSASSWRRAAGWPFARSAAWAASL